MGSTIRKSFSSYRGSLLVEMTFLMLPITIFFLFNLEVFRRSVFEVVLFRLSCEEVRDAVLGIPREKTNQKTKFFLQRALGEQLGIRVHRASNARLFRVETRAELNRLRLGTQFGGVAERYYRYAQFISFEFRNQKKHHQEIIKRCLFPF